MDGRFAGLEVCSLRIEDGARNTQMHAMRCATQVNARAIDPDDIFTGEVRSIQDAYPEAHQALRNWGLWSRDRSGIYPSLAPPALWELFVASKVDWNEELGEPIRLPVAAKPERAETPPYNEKEAIEIDELLHAGEFCYDIRKCLLVAYVTWDVRESQFPDLARCPPKDFLLRFDAALSRLQEALE